MEYEKLDLDEFIIWPAQMKNKPAYTVPTVEFHRLGAKMVENANEIPDDSADIMYYTLNVGHHTGIIDMFDIAKTIPLDFYKKVVCAMQVEDAKKKLQGVIDFSEIEVNKASAKSVIDGLVLLREDESLTVDFSAEEVKDLDFLIELFKEVRDVQAFYVLVRRVS